MAYNKKLHQDSLDKITRALIKEAILLCYEDGITTLAPLGCSGDTVLLHGTEQGGRKSVVSIRNYCGDAELLITDTMGTFLFYGRYDIGFGLDFVAAQYWLIFKQVRDKIEGVMPKADLKKIEFNKDCKPTEGFKYLEIFK